jgi:hypothetical protein
VFPGTDIVTTSKITQAMGPVLDKEAPTPADAEQRARAQLLSATRALLISADHSLVIKAGKKKSSKEYSAAV